MLQYRFVGQTTGVRFLFGLDHSLKTMPPSRCTAWCGVGLANVSQAEACTGSPTRHPSL